MHAVNSAVGPEVQEDYFPPERLQADRAIGVEPLETRREIRSPDGMRWHLTPHDPLPRGVFRVCEEAIISFPQIVTTCSRQLILAHRFIGVKGLIRMEWGLRMSEWLHSMEDRRENWLDPGGGQGKNKIPGAPVCRILVIRRRSQTVT